MSGPELFKARMKWMCEQNRLLNPRNIQTDSTTDTPDTHTLPDSSVKSPSYTPVLNENTLMVGMSATASPEECWECFTAGMHFFVAKPVDSSIMLILVESAHIIGQGRYRTTQALPLARTSDVAPLADVAALTYSTDDYLAQADRFLRASKQCEEYIHDDCGAHKCGVIISAPLTHIQQEASTTHSPISKVGTKSSKENGDTRPASTANMATHALGLSDEGGGYGEGDNNNNNNNNNIEHYVEVKPSASLARRIMRSFSAHLRLNA